MNEQLIKFIELCLEDGVISDKEREVIFRKSKELGVPDDECEIILDGIIQKLGKTIDNTIESDDSHSQNEDIESILSLDKSLLVNFSHYLNSMEEQLEQLYDSKRINDIFRNWYKNFGSRLIKRSEKYFIKGENGKEEEWLKVEISKIKVQNIKRQMLVSGWGYSGKRKLLFTTSGVHIISEHKGIFTPKNSYKIDKNIRIESIDITDFKSENIDNLYFLLRIFWGMGFLSDNKILDTCLEVLKSKFLSESITSITKYLPKTTLFGDDLVIKLTTHISKLLENFNNELNKYQKEDLVPITDLSWGNIGFNIKNIRKLDYIISSIKNISSLVSLRNQLLYSVLTENRSSILIIKEKMDDQGILLTHYQRENLEKMDDVVNTLKEGFEKLSGMVMNLSSQLEEINTSINQGNLQIKERLEFNNLLTGIQTYQMYKINKNTKSLRG